MLVMVDKPKTRDVEPLPPHVQRYVGTMFDRTLMLPEGTLGSVMGGDEWDEYVWEPEGLRPQLERAGVTIDEGLEFALRKKNYHYNPTRDVMVLNDN